MRSVGRRRLSGAALVVAILLALPAVDPIAAVTAAAELAIREDVEYGSPDGVRLLLDVIAPPEGVHPAVLVIHGGGWASGDKDGWRGEGEALARAGFVAFVVTYRLAPPRGSWHAPAQIDDVRTALAWVRTNGAAYGADPSRVGVLGGSAGGNLAMMLGVTGEPGLARADAVVSWSGASDLRRWAAGSSMESRINYVGCRPAECPERWAAASPLAHIDDGSAPMYLALSFGEPLPNEQAEVMAAELRRVGVPARARIVDGDGHAREYRDQVWEETITFLRHHLGG